MSPEHPAGRRSDGPGATLQRHLRAERDALLWKLDGLCFGPTSGAWPT